jgi:nitrous oxide reductase accessory protein NosL
VKKKKAAALVLSAIIIIALSSLAGASDSKPVQVKEADKCPVCGMFVAKYTDWIAQIVFRDGTYAAFDGPKDMFKYYFHIDKYAPSKKQSDIAAIFVTEYYSTELVDAKSLLFITGSDVYGPMGSELIPVGSMDTAKEFMKDHRGKKILKFGEIDEEDLK